MKDQKSTLCPSCGQSRLADQMRDGKTLTPAVAAKIKQTHTSWAGDQPVCAVCVREGEASYMAQELTTAVGPLNDLEQNVLHSIRESQLLTRNENESLAVETMLTERVSASVARIVGSWTFPIGIVLFILGWAIVNIAFRPYAPYPTIIFSVISAVLGGLAALHGPFIIMSQRYQQKRDRLRAENDYLINLKAELEIRYLHEKLDLLLARERPPAPGSGAQAA